jgi:peptidoglycan/LPS O-acetylase OafA/YrhL
MHFQGSQAPGNRVEFLDILRGLSSVSVAICHLLIQFFLAPNEYARIIMATPIQQQIVPEWIGYISWIGPNLIITNVAVFFLISGFVIPFSFKKDVLSTYYIKRFFRLYPVYLISLALSICAIVGSALYWQQKVIYNECDWLYNFLLLQDVFIVAFIIPPVWTLVIEIKFYFLAPFFQRYLKKGKIYPYLLLALSLAMYFSYVTSGSGTDIDQFWNHHRYLTRYILRELMFISYITIGSVFFAHHKLLISNRTFVLSVVFIYLCFFISEPISPLPSMSGHYQTPML